MDTICEIKTELISEPKRDTGERKDYYVYHLIDPRDNLPFYVGKGRMERIYDHEKDVLNGRIPHNNKLLFYKIKKVLNESGNIKYVKIFENLESDDSYDKELLEIKKYGRRSNKTGILCNMTDGGEYFVGSKQSEEHIRKRVEKRMVWYNSLPNEEKEKMWKKSGNSIKEYWATHSEEKKKFIEILKSKVWKYGKDHRWYGKNKGKENPSYKPIPKIVEDKIIELHNIGLGKRKIVKEIFNTFGIQLEENKPLNILRFNGISARSIEEINEIKRKKISNDTQNLIIDLYHIKKTSVRQIYKILLNMGIDYGEHAIRNFLKRNNLYVKRWGTKKIL